jgi:hypothetical protein
MPNSRSEGTSGRTTAFEKPLVEAFEIGKLRTRTNKTAVSDANPDDIREISGLTEQPKDRQVSPGFVGRRAKT